MPTSIEKHLAELPNLSRSALSELWKQIHASAPPRQLRRDLMIPILAYQIQEKNLGSLKPGIRNRLRQLSEGFARNPDQAVSSKPTLKPGTRLVREWRDAVHLVNVETNGYAYKGGRYKSLSRIAHLITGTRWSGPLFFGIKGGRATSAGKEAE
jgi:hypothetical protein